VAALTVLFVFDKTSSRPRAKYLKSIYFQRKSFFQAPPLVSQPQSSARSSGRLLPTPLNFRLGSWLWE